jgi:hypothetical protein
VRYPAHAGVGFGILLVGVAVYFLWARKTAIRSESDPERAV